MQSTKEVYYDLLDVRMKIQKVLAHIDFDSSNINLEDRMDPNEVFLRDNCSSIVARLSDIANELRYLNRPILEEGRLNKNTNGRYEISGRYEFVSGSPIEVLIWDDFDECEKWVLTRVEHSGDDYVLFHHKELPMAGLRARRR